MNISVIISIYNEEESIKELTDWIVKVMQSNQFSYELILIDDGSTDNTWLIIETLSNEISEVKGIKFRRNYGKSAALYCGF
ncbi:MAG: glycosyltransferase, partial [Bacteroidales bacterium]|nr:glycosyltransferase [Bacteroidales bacterium]